MHGAPCAVLCCGAATAQHHRQAGLLLVSAQSVAIGGITQHSAVQCRYASAHVCSSACCHATPSRLVWRPGVPLAALLLCHSPRAFHAGHTRAAAWLCKAPSHFLPSLPPSLQDQHATTGCASAGRATHAVVVGRVCMHTLFSLSLTWRAWLRPEPRTCLLECVAHLCQRRPMHSGALACRLPAACRERALARSLAQGRVRHPATSCLTATTRD